MSRIIKYIKNPIYFLTILDHMGIIRLNDAQYLKYMYKKAFDKKLDLENPKSFSEKIQWLKLNDKRSFYSTMVDKNEVKKYVADIIGEEYIIPTLGIYNTFDEINFSELPDQFVIKCTHDSGGTAICHDKKCFNIKDARKKINKCLKNNYYYFGREWPYKNVKPRIIIEKYIKDDNDKSMHDYKFFCFNGTAKFCLVCSDRDTKLKETFFDNDWNILPFKRKNNDIEQGCKKPKNLELMIQNANKLSKGIPFIRVDFYEINGQLFFGELTLYPASGFSKFEPDEWDEKIGSWLNIKNKLKKK